jgi:hypothetical protein
MVTIYKIYDPSEVSGKLLGTFNTKKEALAFMEAYGYGKFDTLVDFKKRGII